MIFIDTSGIHDPRVNLAIEEYAVRHLDPETDYFLFYINEPSIIIGRNQNTLEEINHEYVEENGIHVVRRLSGGGAVYHDHGNLNFSFITKYDTTKLHNFKKFNDPIVRVLNNLGVPAEMSGRNDIVADGRKISGNAQFSTPRRMFSHGTLLFDSDLGEVVNALNVKMSKIQSKGHKSVRSRVANISEFLDEDITIEHLRDEIVRTIFNSDEPTEVYELTDDDWEKIEEISDERYRNWDWNYGRSPEFNIQRSRRFPIGEIDLRLDVKKGHIKNITIYGDFFGKTSVKDIEEALQGVRYERASLEEALRDFDIHDYFGALPREDFMELLYGADEEPSEMEVGNHRDSDGTK